MQVPLQYQFPLHSLPELSLLGKIGKDPHPLDPPLHNVQVPLQYQFPLHSLPELSLLGKIGKDPHPQIPLSMTSTSQSLPPKSPSPPRSPSPPPPDPPLHPQITVSPQIPIPLSASLSHVNTTVKFNPPNTNSESENSDFEDLSDDDFGIPIDGSPSRPMVNFANDMERRKIMKLVGNGLKKILDL